MDIKHSIYMPSTFVIVLLDKHAPRGPFRISVAFLSSILLHFIACMGMIFVHLLEDPIKSQQRLTRLPLENFVAYFKPAADVKLTL